MGYHIPLITDRCNAFLTIEIHGSSSNLRPCSVPCNACGYLRLRICTTSAVIMAMHTRVCIPCQCSPQGLYARLLPQVPNVTARPARYSQQWSPACTECVNLSHRPTFDIKACSVPPAISPCLPKARPHQQTKTTKTSYATPLCPLPQAHIRLQGVQSASSNLALPAQNTASSAAAIGRAPRAYTSARGTQDSAAGGFVFAESSSVDLCVPCPYVEKVLLAGLHVRIGQHCCPCTPFPYCSHLGLRLSFFLSFMHWCTRHC